MKREINNAMRLSVYLIIICIACIAACGPRSGTQGSTDKRPPKDAAIIDSTYLRSCARSFGQGMQLFMQHCSSCHVPPHKQVCDSYTFDAYFERVPQPAEDYFISFISDSKLLKASGDVYATKISEAYDSSYDHHFKDSLSEHDLSDLIFYIKLGLKLKNR